MTIELTWYQLRKLAGGVRSSADSADTERITSMPTVAVSKRNTRAISPPALAYPIMPMVSSPCLTDRRVGGKRPKSFRRNELAHDVCRQVCRQATARPWPDARRLCIALSAQREMPV